MHARLAVTYIDVMERAGDDMAVERLDRAAQPARSLSGREQTIRRRKRRQGARGRLDERPDAII
jgi:hypothetical protein